MLKNRYLESKVRGASSQSSRAYGTQSSAGDHLVDTSLRERCFICQLFSLLLEQKTLQWMYSIASILSIEIMSTQTLRWWEGSITQGTVKHNMGWISQPLHVAVFYLVLSLFRKCLPGILSWQQHLQLRWSSFKCGVLGTSGGSPIPERRLKDGAWEDMVPALPGQHHTPGAKTSDCKNEKLTWRYLDTLVCIWMSQTKPRYARRCGQETCIRNNKIWKWKMAAALSYRYSFPNTQCPWEQPEA